MTFCYFFLSPLVYVLGCGKLWFMFFCLRYTLEERSFGASQVAQMVKNLPAMQEIRVQSLGREDHLEKGMETHSSILAWRIPWSEEPGRLQSMGLQWVRHDWARNTHTHTHTHITWLLSVLEVTWGFKWFSHRYTYMSPIFTLLYLTFIDSCMFG